MIIQLPQPCSENWDEMKPVSGCGRHCASCDKEVVDFTGMNDNQLFHFLNAHEDICGRFAPHQLDRDILPYYEGNHRWRFCGWALTVGLMFAAPPMVRAQFHTDIKMVEPKEKTGNGTIKGSVSNGENLCIQGSVEVLLIKDGEVIRTAVLFSGANTFGFGNLAAGNYTLEINSYKYETLTQPISLRNSSIDVVAVLKPDTTVSRDLLPYGCTGQPVVIKEPVKLQTPIKIETKNRKVKRKT